MTMLAIQLPSKEVSKPSFLSADVADFIPAKIYEKPTPNMYLSVFCANKFTFLLPNIPFIWI